VSESGGDLRTNGTHNTGNSFTSWASISFLNVTRSRGSAFCRRLSTWLPVCVSWWNGKMKRVFFSRKNCLSTKPAKHHTVRSDRIWSPSPQRAALETLPGTKLETGNETKPRCSDTTVITSPTKHSGNLGRQHFPIWKHTTLLHTTCTLDHTLKNFLNYTVCTDCQVYRKAKHVFTRTLCWRNFCFISLKYVHIGQSVAEIHRRFRSTRCLHLEQWKTYSESHTREQNFLSHCPQT
jgi:hypothetical protein